MELERGSRVRLPGETGFVIVDMAQPRPDGGIDLYVLDGRDARRVELASSQLPDIVQLIPDGAATPSRTLAALWSRWMSQAAESVEGTALGSAPLRPYLHQHDAVYGAMLPQPMLRFLLADEPRHRQAHHGRPVLHRSKPSLCGESDTCSVPRPPRREVAGRYLPVLWA